MGNPRARVPLPLPLRGSTAQRASLRVRRPHVRNRGCNRPLAVQPGVEDIFTRAGKEQVNIVYITTER